MSEPNKVNPYADRANQHPEFLINDSAEGLNFEQKQQLTLICENAENLQLEIGSGSGQFLIETARRFPTAFIIGVELRYKRSVRTVEKAKKLGVANFLVCRSYAENILELLPNNILDCIYINFPDPWDKKRWLKHRIISPDNLKIFSQKLKPQGRILFKTDHAEYFDWAINIFKNSADFKISKETKDLHKSSWAAENILTEFEQLFLSKKLPVHFLEACLIDGK